MLKETIIDKMLFRVKKLIPKSVFNFFAPAYHGGLAYVGAWWHGFPSKKLKVIGVTGTKGKSTVVSLITKILDGSGKPVAAIGSLGFKIKDKEWPNNLKMTMPGRFKLQKFLREALDAGCEYVIMEVTSEGIKQKRHLGIQFDCAVFTNLHKEHIESHGSFEKYYQAKQELFKRTDKVHVINADDPNTELFGNFPAKRKIFYGLKRGDLVANKVYLSLEGASFEVYGTFFTTHLAGEFNVLNCLAALAIGVMYGLDLPSMKPALEKIAMIPGRMEFIPVFIKTLAGEQRKFKVVIDYAHTPDSLEAVYKTLKDQPSTPISRRLICVLGAAGGGRDAWKRPEFGKIAAKYCNEIILTNEDPYDENPLSILDKIESGFSQSGIRNPPYTKILDRKEAIQKAIALAKNDDIVIITGKGSETSMAVSGNQKVPWSDREIVSRLINA